MKIISHRGFWYKPEEKNSLLALKRSIEHGYGCETDVRDSNRQLVLSHDLPEHNSIIWRDVISLFEGSDLPLAVNIKADGLADELLEAFKGSAVSWFAFDMSGPETFQYALKGLPFYSRHSDIETLPICYNTCEGIWLDSLQREWFDEAVIKRHLEANKSVCVVSSELHGRDHSSLWAMLRGLKQEPGLMLCTDFPDRAKGCFS